MIVDIGHWVRAQVFRQFREWSQAGFELVTIAINVSSKEFARKSILETIVKEILSAKLRPELLELEITERTMVRDIENTEVNFKLISDMNSYALFW